MEKMDEMRMIPLSEFVDSPFQPRTEYHGLEELAVSIEKNGILQSVLCREIGPRPQDGFIIPPAYELVAGHRRVRAAKMAGLEVVPAIVRSMSDAEVREAILVENGQREDLAPLEELQIYEGLRDQGFEIAEIASRIGKAERHVYRRLALANLCTEGREALAAGVLHVGVAELLARISDSVVQAKGVRALSGDEHTDPAGVASARNWIQHHAARKLKLATFDTTDDTMVGGACSACTRNSAGTQLFPDLEEATCYDAECWAQKTEAAWYQRAAAAQDAGMTVLVGEEAEKTLQYGQPKAGWVRLDQTVWIGDKSKKLETQLGKARVKELTRYLVRDRGGNEYTLVKRAELKKVMREQPKESDPPIFSGAKNTHQHAEERTKKIATRYRALVLEQVATAIETEPFGGDMEMWVLLALGMVERSWADTLRAAERRRKIAIDGDTPEQEAADKLVGWIKRRRDGQVLHADDGRREFATMEDLQILVLELMLTPALANPSLGAPSAFLEKLQLQGMTGGTEALWAEAERQIDEKAAAKAAKATAKANGSDEKPKRKKKPEPEDPLRKIFALYEEGKSYREIAELTGLSKDAVARRIKKGRGA